MKKAPIKSSTPLALPQPVEPPKRCREGLIDSIPCPDKFFDRPRDPDMRVVLACLIAMQPHWVSGEDISTVVYANLPSLIDGLRGRGCEISEYRHGSGETGVFYRLEALFANLLPMRPLKGGV